MVLHGGVWEQGEKLGFLRPDGFTTLSSSLDGTAASYKCRASGIPSRLPNSKQLELAAPSAPWWVPGQRHSSREELARGGREQGGEERWFMAVW